MIYCGIGSRQTPKDVLQTMVKIGAYLAKRGDILRSGGAIGADAAFEQGCGTGKKEIYLAKDCTPMAKELSSHFHPAWHLCSDLAKNLHGRNAMIVLGQNLDTPADMVICWTADGKASGGSGQTLRIAASRGIPVFNLFFDKQLDLLRDLLMNEKQTKI